MDSQKYKFSDELMQRSKKYFDKRCGQEVSLEETEQWLDSLADVVSALTNGLNKKNYEKE